MARSLYDAIGVSRKATSAEIEEACLALGETFRPDRHPGDAHAAERFCEIERAYDVLLDLNRRFLYDQELRVRRMGGSLLRSAGSEDGPASYRLAENTL